MTDLHSSKKLNSQRSAPVLNPDESAAFNGSKVSVKKKTGGQKQNQN